MNKRWIYMLSAMVVIALPLQSAIPILSAQAAKEAVKYAHLLQVPVSTIREMGLSTAKELFAKRALQAGSMGLDASGLNIVRAHLTSFGAKATNVASGVVVSTVPALVAPVKKNGMKELWAAFCATTAVKRVLYVMNIIAGVDFTCMALNGARALDEKIAANALARRPFYVKAYAALKSNKQMTALAAGTLFLGSVGYVVLKNRKSKQQLSA